MDYEDECGELSEANTFASDIRHVTFSPRIIVLNSDHGGGCGPDSGTNRTGSEHGSAESPDFSDTDSSSLSNSSFDEFIIGNPQMLPKSGGENNISQPTGGTEPSYKNEKLNVTNEALYRLEESINESPESTSRVSDVTQECLVQHISPTLSPSIQVMERPEALGRSRSPASIFSRPTTPKVGSATSDDSLFSIHMENTTFSRDDAYGTGVDSYKPGELPKSQELLKSGELRQSEEPCKSRELGPCGELSQSGELHKSREFQSAEHFKATDLKRSGELIRLRQTSPTTKGIDPKIRLGMAKTIYEDLNHGGAGMVDGTINDVLKAVINKCQSDEIETSI